MSIEQALENKDVYCILAGIDTLELGFCVRQYTFPSDIWELLTQAKENARSTDYSNDLGALNFCGYTFIINRGGAQRYNFILRNQDIELKINQEAKDGKYFPEVHIKFMAAFLWRSGWQSAMNKTIEWVKEWADVRAVVVSRCDIAVDFGCELPVLSQDFKELVTRAKKKEAHFERYQDGLNLTGYSIGGSSLMCRIYDKLNEIKKSNKDWFKELWQKNGWQELQPVMRVEFQCRRTILRTMQIHSPDDLEYQLADLFKYLTEQWLTIRSIGTDSHRSRWPISNLWQAVQCAIGQFGQVTGIIRLKQLRPRYTHLTKQLRGLLVSMVALTSESLNAPDNRIPIAQIRHLVRSTTAKADFDIDVSKRRAKYAGMDNRL
jgi:hypothetical protein